MRRESVTTGPRRELTLTLMAWGLESPIKCPDCPGEASTKKAGGWIGHRGGCFLGQSSALAVVEEILSHHSQLQAEASSHPSQGDSQDALSTSQDCCRQFRCRDTWSQRQGLGT